MLTNINVKVTRQTIQKGHENIQCYHLNLVEFYSRVYFKLHRIRIFFAISCPFSDVKQINGIFEIKNRQKKDANFEAIQIAPDAVYFLESCQNLCFLWPNTAIYNVSI